jgi:hypothetical protein
MQSIQTEEQLEDALSAPNAADIAAAGRLTGTVVVLGAGGKMGPSLVRRVKRAAEAAGVSLRVLAVSRFQSAAAQTALAQVGIETRSADLLDRRAVDALPEAEHVLYLAGRKFGSSERADLTWAGNTTEVWTLC